MANTEKPVKTYLDKEKDLIQAIAEDQKKPQGDRIFDSMDDGIETISESLESFPGYVNNVVWYTQRIPIVYATMEGQDLRDEVMRLDRAGRSRSRLRRHYGADRRMGAQERRVGDHPSLPPVRHAALQPRSR